jgi:hypothetical protein
MKQGSSAQYAEVQSFYCKVLMETGEQKRQAGRMGDPVHAWRDNKKKCRSAELPNVLEETKSLIG